MNRKMGYFQKLIFHDILHEEREDETFRKQREIKIHYFFTHQKKISKIAFFAKRGDFIRSNRVALSV